MKDVLIIGSGCIAKSTLAAFALSGTPFATVLANQIKDKEDRLHKEAKMQSSVLATKITFGMMGGVPLSKDVPKKADRIPCPTSRRKYRRK